VLREEELGEWRRTHHSSQIKPDLNDANVLVMGWISSIRDHGNIVFIMLTDKDGEMQVTAKLDECGEELFDKIRKVKEHSSICVRGKHDEYNVSMITYAGDPSHNKNISIIQVRLYLR